MKINHLNLGLTDVLATAAMFERHFGFTRMPGPYTDKMAFLIDDAGSLISLFKAKDVVYPKIFHVGFMLESKAQVDAMHDRLAADGLNPEEPREEHSRYTFYFKCPGGVLVEVNSPSGSNSGPMRDGVSLNHA